MTYHLPELPYDFNALEPVISALIMELHYTKHHKGYVDNLNAAIEKYHAAEAKGDVAEMIALSQAIKFNGGGHVNHSIFWTNLAPIGMGGGEHPKGELAHALQKKYGTIQHFIDKMSAAAVGIQGSADGPGSGITPRRIALGWRRAQTRTRSVRRGWSPCSGQCLGARLLPAV